MDQHDNQPLFSETQRFDQLWVRAVCVVIFVVCVYVGNKMTFGMLSAPACKQPPLIVFSLVMLVLAVGAIVTLGMLFGTMETTLDPYALTVKMLFFTRVFPLNLVTRCQAVSYNGINEYGGWGFRRKFGDKSTMAYTTSGDRGVMFELSDGRKILVGSKKAEELENALNATRRHG